jgi:hypothetical protein
MTRRHAQPEIKMSCPKAEPRQAKGLSFVVRRFASAWESSPPVRRPAELSLVRNAIAPDTMAAAVDPALDGAGAEVVVGGDGGR